MQGEREQRCTTGRRPGPTAPGADTATGPTGPSGPSGSLALTVGRVVAPGSTVALDDSDLVRALLDAVLAARPALIGTTSLDAVLELTARRVTQDGDVTVRLFGGMCSEGACDGPRAVADTRCDVAFLSGRLVGDTVYVPADVRPTRWALLACTRRCYLVLPAADTGAGPAPAGWLPLAGLGSFDGLFELDAGVPQPVRGHRAA